MVLIPRGLTCLAPGTFIANTRVLEFDTADARSDFGIVDFPLQAAEARVI